MPLPDERSPAAAITSNAKTTAARLRPGLSQSKIVLNRMSQSGAVLRSATTECPAEIDLIAFRASALRAQSVMNEAAFGYTEDWPWGRENSDVPCR
jgi:hypothetical protein